MTQWAYEQEQKAKQTKLCNKLAKNLEAVIEEFGFHMSTKMLESCEKVLHEWRNK